MELARIKEVLLRWVFPQTCAHCAEDLADETLGPLCPACRKMLSPSQPGGCLRCGVPRSGHSPFCAACSKSLFACRLIRAAYLYRGPAVSLVHSFKFRGRRSVAKDAGDWMAKRLELFPELAGFDAVVPVPLHKSRMIERGYNQALRLAESVSRESGAPVMELLIRHRKTRAQWRLGRQKRKENLKGAFAAAPEGSRLAAGKRLLLVDDVATSTASLEECAKTLQECGAAWVGAFVFARQYSR